MIDEPEPLTGERFEKMGEAYEEREVGGGGKGSGRKYGDPGSEGRRQARAKQREAAKWNTYQKNGAGGRIKEAATKILAYDQERADMWHAIKYRDWLVESLLSGNNFDLRDRDIDWRNYTPSVRAGGTGRQTSVNGREAVHMITFISAAAEGDRSGDKNAKVARNKLRAKLLKHLSDWKAYLEFEGGVTAEIRAGKLLSVDKKRLESILDRELAKFIP